MPVKSAAPAKASAPSHLEPNQAPEAPVEAPPEDKVFLGDRLSLYIWFGGVVLISILLVKELLVGLLPR